MQLQEHHSWRKTGKLMIYSSLGGGISTRTVQIYSKSSTDDPAQARHDGVVLLYSTGANGVMLFSEYIHIYICSTRCGEYHDGEASSSTISTHHTTAYVTEV